MTLRNPTACPVSSKVSVAVSDLNLFDPERLSCPHATWAQLRREAPIYRMPMPGISTPVFVATRRVEIDYIARHPQLFSNSAVGEVWRWGDFPREIKELFAERGYKVVHTLQSSDPPAHATYRKIAESALTLQKVKALKPLIERLVDELIVTLPENESFNFVDSFSVPLPMQVICLILGLPINDAKYLRDESDSFVRLVDPTFSLEQAIEGAKGVVAGYDYFAAHIRRLRANPDGSLMSAYANARTENGELLSMDEVLSMAQVTTLGGNETTRNAISSCARILAASKELWRKLKDDSVKIPEFVEEVLRSNAPVNTTTRRALADTKIGDVEIPKGSAIFVMWGAGGTDEAMFEDPLTIDLDRRNKRAHFTFGLGIHFCIGSQLARSEIQTSIAAWLRDFETMELAVSEKDVRYEPLFGIHALNHLPIRITRTKNTVRGHRI